MEDLFSNKKEKPSILSIVATKSGMGKTTLIERLIGILKKRGYSVGVLKHDAHNFEIDKRGKDSYKFTEAGADNVIISSRKKIAMVRQLKEELPVEEIIKLFGNVDIIIIEGFKNNNFPKIEVHRKEIDSELLYNNAKFNTATFIAIASDEDIKADIQVLDINDYISIAEFIINYYSEIH